MRAAVNVVLVSCVVVFHGSAARAQHADRWVPSLALLGGVTVQQQSGFQSATRARTDPNDTSPTCAPPSLITNCVKPLGRPATGRDDRVVSPFVGAAVELMTPGLPVLWSPRFFASGEFLPTFASERGLAVSGQPSRIRGPEVGALLAGEEDNTHFTTGAPGTQLGPRPRAFGDGEANGQGMRINAQVDELMFGAKAGVAFAFEVRGREVRIKPSAGWIHYKVEATGTLVDATCRPAPVFGQPDASRCTNTYFQNGTLNLPGYFRESIVNGHDSGVFDGFGPGVDLEMDTGRIGPLGAAVFLGFHAYYIPGDRDIHFTGSQSFNDQFGADTDTAAYNVRVVPWLYRAGVGVRFQWLGNKE